MITQLNGKLVEKNPTELVVDCNGVGYEVKISLTTFTSLGNEEAVKIFTKLIVREDAHILYGFATKEEREMFTYLISVSGIGPKVALSILGALTPEDLGLLNSLRLVFLMMPFLVQRIILC